MCISYALVSHSATRADDHLNVVREAFRASSTSFASGVARGTFREYRGKTVAEMKLADDALVEISYDKPKYSVRLVYSKEKLETDERRIFFDGTMVASCDRTPNIKPTGCATVLRNFENRGDGLARPDSSEFPWDASKLANHAFNFEPLLQKHPESLKWETLPNGDLVGTIPLVAPRGLPPGLCRFVCAKRFGFNLTERQYFSTAGKPSFDDYALTWNQTKQGQWYVASIRKQVIIDSGPHHLAVRDELEITDFEPNVPIDPKLFTLSVFEMPPRSRIIDTRPDGQIYRVP
jgi:hypothetical protein